MRIGKWQFRPRLWPTVVTAVLFPVLILLGFWQLHRADYKRGLLQQYVHVASLAPLSLNQVVAAGKLTELPHYRHVSVRGHYDSTRQVLLQDMANAGEDGYDVLTPLVLAPGGAILMVDRGFIARAPGVKTLPDVEVSSAPRTVSGVMATLPAPGLRVGTIIVPPGWPKVILFPTYATLTGLYGHALLQPLLQLDAGDSDGFVRNWRPSVGMTPLRHDAYAMQWYALALALLIIWIVVNTKRVTANG
ncbi:MAG: SURF1 family protein [Gammaproteobacteria bacterium]